MRYFVAKALNGSASCKTRALWTEWEVEGWVQAAIDYNKETFWFAPGCPEEIREKTRALFSEVLPDSDLWPPLDHIMNEL